MDESVFISSIGGTKNKRKAKLTYGKGMKSAVKGDALKTDKMDSLNSDTYQVPLKNNLMSYNITSIDGVNVMHYFKNYFDHKDTNMQIDGENYELEMEAEEFNKFMDTFNKKVGAVISHYTNQFKINNSNIEFTKISVFPVPSSSRFNEEMANALTNQICAGLPVQKVDGRLLRKDTSNLQMDKEFIEKNKEYYNSRRNNNGTDRNTHLNALLSDLNRLKVYSTVKEQIAIADEMAEKLINLYHQKTQKKTPRAITLWTRKLAWAFLNYNKAVEKIKELSVFHNEVEDRDAKIQLSLIATAIKYTKGPSVIKRTDEIWNYVKPLIYGSGLNRYIINDVCRWEPLDFQIKRLGNDVRMGLKNYFQVNDDENFKQKELKKMEGGVVVVFDDNISGGATLSDICSQLQQLGIKYIIPITFGKMRVAWSLGPNVPINKPNPNWLSENYESKKDLTILWLDDKREPYNYFKSIENDKRKGKDLGGARTRNGNFYENNIFNKYNVSFKWVKNLDEFSSYIQANGLPEFISFDRDLTPSRWKKEHNEPFPDGLACIKWLKNYCANSGQNLPNCFVHSANTARIPEMEAELGAAALSQKILRENLINLVTESIIRKISNA